MPARLAPQLSRALSTTQMKSPGGSHSPCSQPAPPCRPACSRDVLQRTEILLRRRAGPCRACDRPAFRAALAPTAAAARRKPMTQPSAKASRSSCTATIKLNADPPSSRPASSTCPTCPQEPRPVPRHPDQGAHLSDDDGRADRPSSSSAPSPLVPLHEHTALEQTYVLEGTLEDHEGVCGPGRFCWRPTGNRARGNHAQGRAGWLGFFPQARPLRLRREVLHRGRADAGHPGRPGSDTAALAAPHVALGTSASRSARRASSRLSRGGRWPLRGLVAISGGEQHRVARSADAATPLQAMS